MQNLIHILNSMLYLIPSILLFLNVFRHGLRQGVGGRTLAVYGLLLSVVTAAASVTAEIPQTPADPALVQKLAVAFYIIIDLTLIVLLCRRVISATYSQLLFVIMLLCWYADSIDLFCTMMSDLRDRLGWPQEGMGLYLAIHCVAAVASMPLMWLFLERIVRPMVESAHTLPYWRRLWIIPAFFYVLYRVVIYPAAYLVGKGQEGLLVFLPVVWIPGTMLCYFITLRMLSETARNVELRTRLYWSDQQLQLQKQQFDRFQESIAELNRERHDRRHHILVLQEYVRTGNLEKLREYLEQYRESVERPLSVRPVCENAAVNVLAIHFAERARECGAAVDYRFDLPAELPVSESDACIVIGNLLENAAEACARQKEKERFIEATASLTGETVLLVRVRNSYEHPIRCEDGAYLSSKREGAGIGLASVRALAERHHGSAKFSYSGGVFEATVLLS